MNTFRYRDMRRQRLAEALAMLQPEQDALRELLEREQTALHANDWSVTDHTYLAVAEDWLWNARLLLKDSVNADPLFSALGNPAAISDEQAAAIENLPHSPAGPPADYLAQVRAAIVEDEAILTELVHAAHQVWLEQPAAERPYPFDDVAVLLPLRLETLFDAPQSRQNDDPTRWKLLLRVIPDEASICRDNSYTSADELAALRRFWQAVRQPGPLDLAWLDGDLAGVAWQQFSKQVTAPRAAYLVARHIPVLEGDELRIELPANMPPAPQPNRVGGMPSQLHVWASTRDGNDIVTTQLIGRLPMDAAATIDADALTLELPDTADNSRHAWWNSWERAKEIGLGGEWLLADGLSPDLLEAIYVIGVGDEPPNDHFRAQSDAGELGVLRLGAATNTVHGKPAADLATDAEGWRRVARIRMQQELDPNINMASSTGKNIEQQLTGATGKLPFFPAADSFDDTKDSQRMAQALWPALQGHWLADIWEKSEDAMRVNRWAFAISDQAVSSIGRVRKTLHRPCDDPPEQPEHHFCPEGPLMPLRIGDQPYGLLPTTALSQWQLGNAFTADAQQQQRVELGMARALSRLRGMWASVARRGGTVVGASSERFMELLGRDALSRRYIQRSFAPASWWATAYQLDLAGTQAFEQLARDYYKLPAELFGDALKIPYLSNGYWQNTRLPLVQPWRTLERHRNGQERGRVAIGRFLALLLDLEDELDFQHIFERWWVLEAGGEYKLRMLPNSLLIRLLIHACQITNQWLRTQAASPNTLALLQAQLEAARAICCELDQPAWNPDERDPETGDQLFRIVIPEERRAQLERALRATLDSAAHRIDPWITGFAWQRLKQHSASPRHRHRLGAYGWLDGPFIGDPGPTNAGRLHTPSYNQTLAAIILRDKFLSSQRAGLTNQTGRNPWDMNISSRKARLAEEIADEVRMGFHIYEIIGRHVEHIIATHQKIKELRTSPTYAMRSERLDPNEVCNGLEAMNGLLAGDAQFPLDDSQRASLQELHAALDTYADLLMADGVMQLVNRQAERAAETMDAASGFSRPPSFEFLRTPPSGYHLETLVMTTLPYVPIDAVAADASPVRLADPSLAAFLEQQLGNAWLWTAMNQDDKTQLGQLSLADLGLTPLDTLALSSEFLCELARRTLGLPLVFISQGQQRMWAIRDADGNSLGTLSLIDLRLLPAELAALDEAALYDRLRAQRGAPADSIIEEILPDDLRLWTAVDEYGSLLGMASIETLALSAEVASTIDQPSLHRLVRQALGLANLRIEPARQHELAQHLAGSLGNRPAAGRDITQDPAAQRSIDAAIYAELLGRYTALYSACQNLIAVLRAAADDAERSSLLRRALSWGMTSISEPADHEALFAALLNRVPAAELRPLSELSEMLAQVLEERLKAAPAPADLAPAEQISAPLADHEQRKSLAQPDGVPSLAQAMARLALPQGKLAILACWPQATLLNSTGLNIGQNDAALDESWLTIVAAVRPPLARLEALQLELALPLSAWTSAPGDPWRTGQQQVIQANLQKRAAGSALDMTLNERFAVAYGSDTAFAAESVAVALIDSFNEAVPMPQRSTMTAFGFNAPAARAPQAILLAVPPRLRQQLDHTLLQQIVAETRELAYARSIRIEDLGEWQALAPSMWLQSSGAQRVWLEPYPLFRS